IHTSLPELAWEPVQTYFFPATTTTDKIQTVGSGSAHIGLIDFHYKSSILNELLELDCRVSIIPYATATETLDSLQLDGLLFSNGPGDHAALDHQIATYRDGAARYARSGISRGHQVLASDAGGKTTKLAYGLRGANHPVMNLQAKRVSASSQNHSYVDEQNSL